MYALKGERFWMVWSPMAGQSKKMHVSLAEAQSEAERLAQKEKGKPFYVLEGKEVFVVEEPVKHYLLKEIEEVPF